MLGEEKTPSLSPQKGIIMAEKAENLKDETVETTPEVVEESKTPEQKEEKFAKSGKKSKKHIEEVKAEEERQARKAERAEKEAEEAGKPKGAAPITRPLIERRGKKYQSSAKLVEKGKFYSLKDALELALKTTTTKFDATV